MVLAEMIASGELSALALPGAEPAARRTVHIKGSALSDGIALGHVVLHEPRVVVTNFIADDIPKEMKHLAAAVETLRANLDELLEHGDVVEGGEHRDILEAYRMFAYDRGWIHKLEEAVMTGLTAEAAVERVQSDTRARMLRQTDPFLRERLHDLDDLANRLMRQLTGRDHAPSRESLPENAILVARSMGPAALLDYDRKRLRGLVLEEGGPPFPRRDRRPRARHSGGRRRSTTPPASSIRATPSSSMARPATCMCGRCRTWRRPMPNGYSSARGASSNISRCATSLASPRTAKNLHCCSTPA